jgi:hypothetical protein
MAAGSGRTPKYTEEQIIEWIDEWSSTIKPAKKFFNGKDRISWQHLIDLRGKNTVISEHFTRAQEFRGATIAEGIQDVVEEMRNGEIPADIARVAIDAFKWHASKLAPKNYGDKLQTEHSGEIKTVITGMEII